MAEWRHTSAEWRHTYVCWMAAHVGCWPWEMATLFKQLRASGINLSTKVSLLLVLQQMRVVPLHNALYILMLKQKGRHKLRQWSNVKRNANGYLTCLHDHTSSCAVIATANVPTYRRYRPDGRWISASCCLHTHTYIICPWIYVQSRM